MNELLREISQCTLCATHLELGPRPILSAHASSKIIVIGQAPGSVVHKTGIPWDDKSGENLRRWMGIDNTTFYDARRIALLPMGFCYPGKGKSGDLAPRKECAPLWHDAVLTKIKDAKLILLIGKYAQDYYITQNPKKNLTETVRDFESYLPKYFVLPHPSPRNNIWQAKNPWFKEIVLPSLQLHIKEILRNTD